jgi:Tfp pilus assembly protein PilF
VGLYSASIFNCLSININTLFKGGEKLVEAQSIYNDMIEKYGNSVLLFNGLAVCSMQLKKWNEAEKYLLQALEKVILK